MEKDLIKGNIGNVGEYEAKISGGKLSVGVNFGIGNLLDGLKKLIPGKIDDAIIDVVKGALGVSA